MGTRCRLCSCEKTSLLELDKRYHHCEECDFIFMDASHIVEIAQERQRYLQHNNSMENTGYVQMFTRFINDALEPEFETAQDILDFGCGHAPVFMEIMKNMGKNVDYYDPFFFPDRYFTNRGYDIITSTEVFEHIAYPLEVIYDLRECLNSQGILAIMTRLHPGIQAFEDWWYRMDDTHISFYSEKTLKVLPKISGMKLLRSDLNRYFLLMKNTGRQ